MRGIPKRIDHANEEDEDEDNEKKGRQGERLLTIVTRVIIIRELLLP